ncbi:MAG: deoxyribonuclease IV [Nitrososphaerales archaeon]
MSSILKVGLHISISGSIDRAVDRAAEIGCTAFQIFTRNPRGWNYSPLTTQEAESYVTKSKKFDLLSVTHMPYLPNLASPLADTQKKSLDSLAGELGRCGILEIPYLVTHLGSHLGSGVERGMRNVANICVQALDRADNDVMILLENTAGSKNSVGSSFDQIREIMDMIDSKRVGVCFDTCHAFAAGYDLRTDETITETLEKFDYTVGIDNLKVVHVNDSKGELGGHKDRHEHLGLGQIGEEGFHALLKRKEIRSLPLILETPVDDRRPDVGNLNKLRALAN